MKNYIKTLLKKKKSSKRHFQLLEIMVAVFILLICAAPAMRIYTNMFKQQQVVIRENERDHIARVLHSRIVERFYKRQIPLQELAQGKKFTVDDPDLQKRLKELNYEGGYIIGVVDRKPKDENKPATEYLLRLYIILKDLSPLSPFQSQPKKVENQDPQETIYDYYIYVDAGKDNKLKPGEDVPSADPGNKDKGKASGQSTQGAGTLPHASNTKGKSK